LEGFDLVLLLALIELAALATKFMDNIHIFIGILRQYKVFLNRLQFLSSGLIDCVICSSAWSAHFLRTLLQAQPLPCYKAWKYIDGFSLIFLYLA
jgi:hypothetical protein